MIRTTLLAAILILSASSFATAQGQWETLFDGTSTNHWKAFKKSGFPTQGWVIEDGCLKISAKGGGGDLVTLKEYGDFDLRFEWKVAPGANSGVMYHVTEEFGAPWYTGPEYQILDDALHQDGKNPKTSAGALYALYEAQDKALRPVGEFNSARITCRNQQVEHWLNGVRVVTYTLESEQLLADIAKTKFASMPAFSRRSKGRICLQDHGDDVWYRNIRILDLDTIKPIALFDGTNLEGWTAYLRKDGALKDVWSIKDKALICKGRPIGYIRTEKNYKNFILHLDWRFDPAKGAGNSGVLFRMTGKDKVWPNSIEAQLQSGSAGDFWNIGNFDMKVDPKRTRGRNTKRITTNEKPLGEWNHYEILCSGSTVEICVNGKVLNHAWDVAEIPGKICLQSEGAEIHFKDISLIPLK